MISKAYPSKSSPGTTYVAQVNESTGLLSCNCRGWVNKREGKPRHCAHTKELAAEHGLTLEERDGQMFVVSKAKPVKPLSRGHTDPSFWDSAETRAHKEASPSEFLQPMLASAMVADGLAAAFGADFVMEEKYDGHRIVLAVTLGKVAAWSRTEKSRTLPDHIVAQAALLPDGVYDGELIVPGKHSYDVTAGQNSGTEVLIVFDILRALGQSTLHEPQYRRRSLLEVAFGALDEKQTAIRLIEQLGPSRDAIEKIWRRGGEGVILKRRTGRYQPGFRSADWIKVKKVAAATLTIVGFEPGKVGAYSAVKIRDAEGIETTVKTLDNQTMRAMQANPDSFLGRELVISYQERTPSGKYRHPMWDHLLPAAELAKGRKR